MALKFIQADDQAALKLFLLRRLQQLGDENQTQVTLLSCWLIELMLNQISVLRDQLSSPQTAYSGPQSTMLDRSQREAGLKEATAEFRSLLDMKMVKQSLDVNRNTAYELLLGGYPIIQYIPVHFNGVSFAFFAFLLLPPLEARVGIGSERDGGL